MAEAFIVRRGGGGGSGGTLVVTSSGAGTVTVSNSALGKSYSKSVTAGGSVTFKGLKTGEWTVTLSNGAQTTTKSVTVNADYSVSVAYFSAAISVTYPASSTCTCTDGTTTLNDTNDTSSAKTATFTVPNTGTWTITATNGDRTRSTDVSITADGQSKSVTLKYSLDIIVNGKFNYDVIGSWGPGDSSSGAGSLTEKDGYVQIYGPAPTVFAGSYTAWTSTKVLPTSEYKTLYVDYESVFNGFSEVSFLSIGGVSVTNVSPTVDARNTRAADISSLNTDHQLTLIARVWSGEGHESPVTINIYNLYLE